jgi:hypothetical protein
MLRMRSLAKVEADLVSLRAAAERAGLALACAFSSSAEYERELIEARRAAGAFGPRRRERHLRTALLTGLLAAVFLML